MGRIGRRIEIAHVARNARRAEPHVSAHGRAFVALVARRRSMRPQQRKTIHMILRRSVVQPPTLHGVAVFALRPKLALMQIGVTIRATRAGVGKHFGHMAGVARHARVSPTQGIFRFAIVIEFRFGAQRRPTGGGVAILASECDRAVWIARRCLSVHQRRHP